jgi:hypothetical protein
MSMLRGRGVWIAFKELFLSLRKKGQVKMELVCILED